MKRLYYCDINSLFKYAYQYQEAFEILVKKHKGGSHLILPILFTLRHYLELILKANIKHLSQFSNSKSMLNKIHSEHKLTSLSNSFLEHYKLSKKELGYTQDDSEYITRFKLLSNFFERIDNMSYTFRYPTDKNGNSTIDIDYVDIDFLADDYKKTIILLEYLTDFFPDGL